MEFECKGAVVAAGLGSREDVPQQHGSWLEFLHVRIKQIDGAQVEGRGKSLSFKISPTKA